jgi:hypothetical protein
MKGNLVAGQQIDEIMLAILLQRRFTKMPVLRQKHLGIGMKIGEIAPTAAGNANFLSEFFGMIKHQHTPSTLASLNRAHQPGCPGTNNDHIKIKSHKT